ncbi:hypothetical protein CGZ80_09235 [Rhodopirellula sp. MGV]|nr:hypothetical protein CGZ80_09235 [Rhodopirellula sp. MGV]
MLAGALLIFAAMGSVNVPRAVAQETASSEKTAATAKKDAEIPAETISAIGPMFDRIRQAKSTRAAVEITEETIVGGAVIGSKTATYQIASTAPQSFTVYYKSDQQRSRVYNNNDQATIAISPEAFCHLAKPNGMQDAVFGLPFPMGPYPEPVLALTLAGVDPALSLLNGMETVEIVDRSKFRGETPAIHFKGVQDDAVSWDLWVSAGDKPAPLRLLVDLTEMLRVNGSIELADDYQFVLRFDFKSWAIDLDNSEKLFVYPNLKNARQYDSLHAYFDAQKQTDP